MFHAEQPIELTTIANGKQVFFASDFHLPIQMKDIRCPTPYREEKIMAWLDYIMPHAQALFLLGDIFHFWFEYKYLIPKVALSFQNKLLALHQANIPVYYFLGNHDYWAMDYLTQACGIQVYKHPASIKIVNHTFLVGHGDFINPTFRETLLSKLYKNTFLTSFFRMLPADWLYWIVETYLNKKSKQNKKYWVFEKNDRIFQYCENKVEPFTHHDFYIFGHTHTPYIKALHSSSIYCNLGDWISNYTYASFDGTQLTLLNF
ncbi:MAG: UDP-2,3-diacylglucosamine diphosphatase [Amoebophilaceae bacterium]|nr:UDP-2,3-diacylglucosamine diphosphatase [Amoebophilaceae bacterium]